MILAIPLVFLIGGFLGWIYGQRRAQNKLAELRRQTQIDRVGTRDQMRRGNSPENSASETRSSSTTDTSLEHSSGSFTSSSLPTNSTFSVEKLSRNPSSALKENAKIGVKNLAGFSEQDFDELYKIAGRVKPLEFDLKLAWRRVSELEKKNIRRSSVNSVKPPSLLFSSVQGNPSVKANLTTTNSAPVSVEQDGNVLDELYRISARVKPLEYDLTQRKLEVKALKQALKQLRRINDKQLVSVRLQAENQSNLQYKAILAENKKKIASLQKTLKEISKSKGEIHTLPSQVERVQKLERERDQLRDQNESQLEHIRVLIEQTNTLESKKKVVQIELSELKQELISSKQRLVGMHENLTQSEKRVAELQKEVSRLNQQLGLRSGELESMQLRLKESGRRAAKLAERLKSVEVQVQQIDEVTSKLQQRERDVRALTIQLSEASLFEARFALSLREIDAHAVQIAQKNNTLAAVTVQVKKHISLTSQLRTELKAKRDLLELQKGRLKQIPVLSENVLKNERELSKAQDKVKQVEQQIQTLTVKSRQADEFEKQLIESNKRIASLQRYESKVADQEKLIFDLKRVHDKAVTEKKVLENNQFQLQRKVTIADQSMSELSRLRAEMEKSKNVESQLAQARGEIDKTRQKDAELARLQAVVVELEQSRVKIDNLSQSLEKAEKAASVAEQNDIEVRRLRSELHSMQAVRRNSASKLQSLEERIQDQEREIATNVQLRRRVQELESLGVESKHRDRQNAELKKRPKKTKLRAPLTPLYAAPDEKDDLKKINGIGPVMEKMLNSLGIASFKQLAEFKSDDIRRVTNAIEAFPGRIERDNWVGGAKAAYAKKYSKADA